MIAIQSIQISLSLKYEEKIKDNYMGIATDYVFDLHGETGLEYAPCTFDTRHVNTSPTWPSFIGLDKVLCFAFMNTFAWWECILAYTSRWTMNCIKLHVPACTRGWLNVVQIILKAIYMLWKRQIRRQWVALSAVIFLPIECPVLVIKVDLVRVYTMFNWEVVR